MKYTKRHYTHEHRMSELVSEHYAVLPVMSRFGIALGFGEKTIEEVCTENGVDTTTFLAVVNLMFDATHTPDIDTISVRTLTDYLHNAHRYFIEFRLPSIRRKLIEAVNCSQHDVTFAIMRYYDDYFGEVSRHIGYEEQVVIPYVEALLAGRPTSDYSIETFRSRHDRVEEHLRELKQIIIKYYPAGGTNELNDALYDIFTCEQELASHNTVEEELYIPAVERLASETPQAVEEERGALSAREREIITCVVKGFTNKEIAEELCILTHTVITHRRNIAAKLQIHSAAGLTIYAIVNKLVDLTELKIEQ